MHTKLGKVMQVLFVTCVQILLIYANSVHLSAIWENIALVKLIRCEPLGEPYSVDMHSIYQSKVLIICQKSHFRS